MRMNGQSMGLSQTSVATAAKLLFAFITEEKVKHERLTYCRDCGDDWTLVFTIQGDTPTAAETKQQDARMRGWKCSACLYLMF